VRDPERGWRTFYECQRSARHSTWDGEEDLPIGHTAWPHPGAPGLPLARNIWSEDEMYPANFARHQRGGRG